MDYPWLISRSGGIPVLISWRWWSQRRGAVALRRRDGSWLPLSPFSSAFFRLSRSVTGKALLSSRITIALSEVLLRKLTPRSLSSQAEDCRTIPGDAIMISSLLFAHLSSNLRGELLVQIGGIEVGSDRTWIHSMNAKGRDLHLDNAGPIRLPDGSGLVVPSYDGLDLLSMNPDEQASEPQSLPGSRELKLLHRLRSGLVVKELADYRRSIELAILDSRHGGFG